MGKIGPGSEKLGDEALKLIEQKIEVFVIKRTNMLILKVL